MKLEKYKTLSFDLSPIVFLEPDIYVLVGQF